MALARARCLECRAAVEFYWCTGIEQHLLIAHAGPGPHGEPGTCCGSNEPFYDSQIVLNLRQLADGSTVELDA